VTAEVADLYITLRSITDPFSKGLKSAAADAESQSKRMSNALAGVAKVGLGIGAALVGVGVTTVDMASKFQQQMTLLQTQAGVSQDKMAGLTKGVLALAGQVGFSPTSLAESLYHVESNFESMGITSANALSLVKIAAEGAAVGNADLVQVTNALTAAVASGIPGVQDMSGAMGYLNKIVGVGDMSMQDLADAFGTGMLATVKGFGVTLADVGAGLATFGDNNIRGALAGNEFRMAIMALGKPVATAGSALAKLGLTQDTLAKDMQKGGMKLALTDLVDRMDKAGIKANQQGQIITDAFGRKAGTGINILIGQFDRTIGKYPKLEEGAGGFQAAWEVTKNTFAQQMKDMRAGADALAVRLGSFLIPQVSKLITLGGSDFGQIASGFTGAATKPVQHAPQHSAFMNGEMSAPSLTGWQKFGQETHRVLGDLQQDVVKLEPVGRDFVRFGDEAWQALQKLAVAAQPVAKVFGTALFLGLEAVGKVLADVVGPAIKWFADFLAGHQKLIEYFSVAVIGGLTLKLAALGTINAVKGLVGLATAIVQFPLKQAGDISTALDGVKTAWSGKAATESEDAVKGLSGAFGDLKTSAGGVLDKFTALNGSKMSGLAKAGEELGKVEQVAAKAPQQLGLFETGLTGIVQVAERGPEQLALFGAAEVGVATEAGTAEVATTGLFSSLSKFILPVAIIAGAGMIGYELGKLAGVGDHTALSMDKLNSSLQLAGAGSATSRSQFTQTAVSMVAMSVAMGSMGMQSQGLKDVDTSLTNLVSSGHAQEAKSQFDDIAAALSKQGIDAQQAASKFPQFEQALKDAGDAAQTMDGKVQSALDSMQRQQGLAQFTSDLGSLQQQLKSTGNALTGTSQDAQNNVTAFRNMTIESLSFYRTERDAHVPMAQANADLLNQYNALEKVGIAALGSKDKADAFLASMGMIKPDYSATLTLDVSSALASLNRVGNAASNLQYSVSHPGGGSGSGHGQLYEDGGFVSGPKGAPQLAIVHGGEYVVSNKMQSGSQHIDPRVLGGMSSRGSAGAGGAGATVVNHYTYNVHVAGSVVTQRQLVDVLRTEVLQHKGRNSHSGWG
jgi:TP901 family phage tail tape measure protein